MEMPRSGFAGAVTCTPSACSRLITSFQLADSAKAPCTRTTVGRDPSCGFVLAASSRPVSSVIGSSRGRGLADLGRAPCDISAHPLDGCGLGELRGTLLLGRSFSYCCPCCSSAPVCYL